jgi:hypothetical protein
VSSGCRADEHSLRGSLIAEPIASSAVGPGRQHNDAPAEQGV